MSIPCQGRNTTWFIFCFIEAPVAPAGTVALVAPAQTPATPLSWPPPCLVLTARASVRRMWTATSVG